VKIHKQNKSKIKKVQASDYLEQLRNGHKVEAVCVNDERATVLNPIKCNFRDKNKFFYSNFII